LAAFCGSIIAKYQGAASSVLLSQLNNFDERPTWLDALDSSCAVSVAFNLVLRKRATGIDVITKPDSPRTTIPVQTHKTVKLLSACNHVDAFLPNMPNQIETRPMAKF
jgi:hypothetical protein